MNFANEQSKTKSPQYQCTYQIWWKSIVVYSSYCHETKIWMCCGQITLSKIDEMFYPRIRKIWILFDWKKAPYQEPCSIFELYPDKLSIYMFWRLDTISGKASLSKSLLSPSWNKKVNYKRNYVPWEQILFISMRPFSDLDLSAEKNNNRRRKS